MEISGWISTISFDHALRISKSLASYHDGAAWFPRLRTAASASVAEDVVMGGSTATDANGSGVMPKWISKRAEGMQGRSREARLTAPFNKVLE